MNSIDFSDSIVQLLLLGMTLSIIVFSIIFLLLLRFFKLYIPKSKLFDDSYIQKSIRNTIILRRSCLAIFVLQIILALAYYFGIIHFAIPEEAVFIIPYFISMSFTMCVGLGPIITHSYRSTLKQHLNGSDIMKAVKDKRMLVNHKLNKKSNTTRTHDTSS